MPRQSSRIEYGVNGPVSRPPAAPALRQRLLSRTSRRETTAAAAFLAFVAPGAQALDLMQAPPGTLSMAVRPNVIVSIDDSGSMAYALNGSQTTNNDTGPIDGNGNWSPNAKRINILKYSLAQAFTDPAVVPDGRIRLAWQSMWNTPLRAAAHRRGWAARKPTRFRATAAPTRRAAAPAALTAPRTGPTPCACWTRSTALTSCGS